MRLDILLMFLVYYTILSSVILLGGTTMFANYNNTISLNETDMSSSEIDTGGLFGTGISFARFIGLVGIGIGLPSDTPYFFVFFYSAWTIIVNILFIGFIIASMWNG